MTRTYLSTGSGGSVTGAVTGAAIGSYTAGTKLTDPQVKNMIDLREYVSITGTSNGGTDYGSYIRTMLADSVSNRLPCTLPPGDLGFTGVIRIVDGAGLFMPQAVSDVKPMTRLVRLDSTGQLAFGQRTTASRYAFGGGLVVDGASIASTVPLVYCGHCAGGALMPLNIINAGGTGLLIEEMQNFSFYNLQIKNPGGSAIVFDGGCGMLIFHCIEVQGAGGNGSYPIISQMTYTPAGGLLYNQPQAVEFIGGNIEASPAAALGLIDIESGADFSFERVAITDNPTTGTRPMIRMRAGASGQNSGTISQRLQIDRCACQGNQTYSTFADLGAGTSLFLDGHSVLQNFKYLWSLASNAVVECATDEIQSGVLAQLDPASAGTMDNVVRHQFYHPLAVHRTQTSDTAFQILLDNQNAVVSTSTTAGTTTVTWVSGTQFSTTTNLGATIRIAGAGAGGAMLTTTLATIASGTSATLTTAASVDVTNALATFAEIGARFRIACDGGIAGGNGKDFLYGVWNINFGGTATLSNIRLGGASLGGGSGGVLAGNTNGVVAPTATSQTWQVWGKNGALRGLTSNGSSNAVVGNWQSKTTSYAALEGDSGVMTSANSGTLTHNPPPASVGWGYEWVCRRTDSSGTITLAGAGTDTIIPLGASSGTITVAAYSSVRLVSDGAGHWYQI